jgi:poly(A) polymerase
MTRPGTHRIMAALGAPEIDVRFVGGCVRNTILDRPVADIDIGTPENPAAVMRRLESAGIKVIPTGIDHGTITAVIDGQPFEVTTLRRDTACDGRHAVVEFTTDWNEDARRRDFTINAMSLRPDGTLFDPHGGVADARAGRVRFVGNPGDRIQEDYLRILRLFRFHAWYGRVPLDKETLDACRTHAPGLAGLSAERIQQELAKLLAAPTPVAGVTAMIETGVARMVLPEVRPEVRSVAPLAALIAIETSAAWVRRLAALIAPETATGIALRLKFSNSDRAHLELISKAEPTISSAGDLHRALHRLGKNVVIDRLLLNSARSGTSTPAFLADAGAWTEKRLPVGGEDVLALGVAAGPRVGALLQALEDWWIDAGFPSARAEVLAKLRDLIAQEKK